MRSPGTTGDGTVWRVPSGSIPSWRHSNSFSLSRSASHISCASLLHQSGRVRPLGAHFLQCAPLPMSSRCRRSPAYSGPSIEWNWQGPAPASGPDSSAHAGLSGAAWMTRHRQEESVTAIVSPVVKSVNCAIRPPSPICWFRRPVYSRPVSFSLKSLATKFICRGCSATKTKVSSLNNRSVVIGVESSTMRRSPR